MSGLNPESFPKQILHSWVIRWLLVILVVVLSVTAIYAAMAGGFETSSQLGSLVVALATFLLVSLTSEYATQTRKLVEGNQRDREQRREERAADHQRELDSLRRALYEEIGKVSYYEDLVDDYDLAQSVVGIASPSTIYESNASKIGLLTDEEIDHIVEYYTRLDRVSQFIEIQKEVDTVIGMGPFEELYRRSEALPRNLLRLLSFGYLGTPTSEIRTEDIKRRFEKLSNAQANALAVIEDNLDSDS